MIHGESMTINSVLRCIIMMHHNVLFDSLGTKLYVIAGLCDRNYRVGAYDMEWNGCIIGTCAKPANQLVIKKNDLELNFVVATNWAALVKRQRRAPVTRCPHNLVKGTSLRQLERWVFDNTIQ